MAVSPAEIMSGLQALRLRARLLPRERPLIASRDRLESDYMEWLRGLFRRYITDRRTGEEVPFAERHHEVWRWVWSIRPGVRPRPFLAIWPRGGGKSTAAELAVVAMAARGARRYALYVSGIQDQADAHVTNIASLLESPAVAAVYPDLASRMVGKYGHSRGWRRNRLRTRAKFTVDALGLDTAAARGIKIEEQRPDLIVIDDLDGEHDSLATTRKKIRTLTRKILPAGSADLAVLFVQNLIIPHGIAARLAGVAGEPADFLADRIVSGPHRALDGMAYEQERRPDGSYRFVIVAGTPTWAGQDLATCQAMIDTYGITAFLHECQQEVQEQPGGIFSHLTYSHVDPDDVPPLIRTVVAVDPAVSDPEESPDADCHGVHVDGLGENGKIYRLFSWEERATPRDALAKALHKCGEYRADALVVETDQGGVLWKLELQALLGEMKGQLGRLYGMRRLPRLVFRKAGAEGPKTHRAQQMLADYERGRFYHVLGTHHVLEAALFRFPRKPLDLVDAAYWAWHELARTGGVGAAPVGIPRASPVMRRF